MVAARCACRGLLQNRPSSHQGAIIRAPCRLWPTRRTHPRPCPGPIRPATFGDAGAPAHGGRSGRLRPRDPVSVIGRSRDCLGGLSAGVRDRGPSPPTARTLGLRQRPDPDVAAIVASAALTFEDLGCKVLELVEERYSITIRLNLWNRGVSTLARATRACARLSRNQRDACLIRRLRSWLATGASPRKCRELL